MSIAPPAPASETGLRVAEAAIRTPGHAVPGRHEMSAAFGVDLGAVEAHDDPAARAACRSLGAAAFALGEHVAFADPSPPPGVVAHELAHVVQQRGGVAPTSSDDSARLEREADRAAGEATSRGRVVAPLSSAPAQLSLLRDLGRISFNSHFLSAPGEVPIRARTVGEWQDFLRLDADETAGSIELNAFMALALGRTDVLSGLAMEQTIVATPPTAEEELALMEAFMTVGTDIDLPESLGEGFTEAQVMMSHHIAGFVARNTTAWIEQRSQNAHELTRGEVENVTAFAEDAEDMQDKGYRWNHPPNPVHSFMTACLGTAAAAATVALLAAKETSGDPAIEERKREAFREIRNASKTIRGCLDYLQAGPDPGLVAIFAGAVSALAALVPGANVVASVTAWGFSGAASAFFPTLLAGEGKERARDLIDEYLATVNRVGEDEDIPADVVENVKNAFESGFNY